MNKADMRDYKLTSKVTDSECYIGGHNCSNCMYAFPGHYCLENTDVSCEEPDICLRAKKQ